MIETTLRVVPTRTVREIMLGKRFQVQARFPGGRIIPLGYSKTRTGAFRVAQRAAAPTGSPTAGGYVYQPGERADAIWRANNERSINQIP